MIYLLIAYFVIGLFFGIFSHKHAVKNYSGSEIEVALTIGLLWLPISIIWMSVELYHKMVEKL